MARKQSILAPDWWDFTTLDDEILNDAARLTPEAMLGLSREGFKVKFYDTLEDFYLAEALGWTFSRYSRPILKKGSVAVLPPSSDQPKSHHRVHIEKYLGATLPTSQFLAGWHKAHRCCSECSICRIGYILSLFLFARVNC